MRGSSRICQSSLRVGRSSNGDREGRKEEKAAKNDGFTAETRRRREAQRSAEQISVTSIQRILFLIPDDGQTSASFILVSDVLRASLRLRGEVFRSSLLPSPLCDSAVRTRP